MPRKPKQEKHKGVFEKGERSGIWWIRYTNEQGKRVTSKVGTSRRRPGLRAAYDRDPSRHSASQLSRRGTKFSELVTDANKFSEKHHRASKDFQQRADLALADFGDRVAESITTAELQAWVDEMAEEREWTGGTQNRFKSTSARFSGGDESRQGHREPGPANPARQRIPGRVRFSPTRRRPSFGKRSPPLCPAASRTKGKRFAQLDVALHTGMRKSEQFTATWEQVDLERGFIYLSMTKTAPTVLSPSTVPP